ncbi:AAA family ATPase [Gracilibacillus caseinilyticus]|uniref:Nuclease SbcCD subunit C n=1 Tax=Gracilibacillus caseinilyticus TaxID=2932256 RepID=A0ABY4EUH6_9BACI|nr:AAA family ATPase [Gracilibacillus caseinilyticus]UOQ47630.1 AAA family ATPase [Gracilibacillus caseinilyticus]
MRALQLEMTAFGPYREKQLIDFTELGAEPIFLITGPTGAGKTTIFDAICFSLYGRASGADRDQEAFRSHFAEVDNQTNVRFTFLLHGKKYQVTRSPKQLKPRARGEGYTEEVASASLYVSNQQEEWELLVSKIKEVNETLEQMIGLDYEQFKKMIMIPQGEFRKLISENSKEREEVLQKIFRTYLYRNITEKLKEESAEIKEQISKLEWRRQQELDKLPEGTIDEQSDAKTKEQLEDHLLSLDEQKENGNRQLEQMTDQLTNLQETFYQQKQLVDYFTEYEQLNIKQQQLAEIEPEIKQRTERLELAKTADKIKPVETLLQTRKQEWQQHQQSLTTLKQQLETNQSRYTQIKETYEQEQKKEPERESLQFQLKEQQKLLDMMDELEAISEKRHQLEQQRQQASKELTNSEKKVTELEQLRDEHYRLKDAMHETSATLQNFEHELEQNVRQSQEIQELKTEYQQLQILRKDYQQYQRVQQKLQDKVNDQTNRCDRLEQERKAHVASDLASYLETGQACPVCGSEHHPSPAANRQQGISEEQLEMEKKQLTDLQNQTNDMQMKLYQIKEQGEAKRQIVNRLLSTIGAETTQDITQSELRKLEQQIMDNLRKRRETQKQANSIWQQQQKEEEKISNTLADYTRIKQHTADLQTKQKQLESEYQQIHAKYAQLMEQLPNDINSVSAFKQQLKQLEEQMQSMHNSWKQVQADYEQALADKHKQETKYNEAIAYNQQLEEKYEQQQSVWHQTLADYHFENETSFKEALLSIDKQQEMEQEINHFYEQKNVQANRLNSLKEWIRDREKPDLAIIREQIATMQQQKDEHSKHLQSIDLYRKQLIEVIRKTNELTVEIEKLHKDYYHIGELADLAKGDNTARLSFERFVLSTFLDEILLQANIRLDKMTDHRYQLIRSEELAKRGAQSGLDLEVLDHYTGRKRSVKTLSGGEGFKAALSLALGMADIVQSYAGGVQLDTLFIDEGFGTLDEISLEQAIACLKDLQRDHRVIGVISHVAQLKEEIKAKLIVESSPDGSAASFKID